MSAPPSRAPLAGEERTQALDVLAALLASTLDGQVEASDVHQALRKNAAAAGSGEGCDDDDDSTWRARAVACAHQRRCSTGPAPPSGGPAPPADAQEWACPMCETLNWAPDPRKSLRRRQEEVAAPAASASAPSSPLLPALVPVRCSCCGFDGAPTPAPTP